MCKEPSIDDLYEKIVGLVYSMCAKTSIGDCNCEELLKPINERFLNV